ncbi:MAG: PaaI family thioesterase [Acidobacteria bacterium]|nr:PaaI family thioesterase [Acidobacteriota bacterium]
MFQACPFIEDLGLVLERLAPGECETSLALRPRHLQQDGYVHAGVQATMADHTGGGAGATLLPEGRIVLSIEFKINLLRPARGQSLRCRAKVLKAGRQVTVVESEVFALDEGKESLTSKATITLATLPAPRRAPGVS